MKWLVVAAALALPPAVLADNVLYRYRNAQGVQVIDFSIPPEFATKGYEVLSAKGEVIKTVPPGGPPLTPAQLRAREAQKAEDAYILRSFSTLKEVEGARQRKLDMTRKEIEILTTNLSDFVHRRAELRQKAADYQASGRDTPEAIAKVLTELDVLEENSLRMLAERKREVDQLNEQFDRYARRLVELRPRAAEGSPSDRAAPQVDTQAEVELPLTP